MGVEHGINPYLHGPAAISHDPVFYYVGHDWRHVATAYGPLYTLLSYPLAPLGVEGALWGMKLMALLASAGTLALDLALRAGARHRPGARRCWPWAPTRCTSIYGLGGAHNDLLMLLADDGRGRPRCCSARRRAAPRSGAAAVIVAGALVKATVAALLPFMILSRRRLAPVARRAAARSSRAR